MQQDKGKQEQRQSAFFPLLPVLEGVEPLNSAQQIQFPNLFWCRSVSKGGFSGGQVRRLLSLVSPSDGTDGR